MRRSRKTAGPPTLDHLTDAHKGETILVLGNSSSLCEMNMYLFDWFTTIGVNRILRAYMPHYVYIGNRSVIHREQTRMREASGRLTFILFGGAMDHDIRRSVGNIYKIMGFKRGLDPTAKSGFIDMGQGPGNSGYQATQMAYRMGASRILLAGIDLHWPRGRKTHFFGDGSKEGCNLRQPEKIASDFARLKALYNDKRVSLCSVSPWDTPLRRILGYADIEDEIANASGHRRSGKGNV